MGEASAMIELHNIDCMEYMAGLPDKAFDLAIVDPPYGIAGEFNFRYRGKPKGLYANIAPSRAYWKELFRVSEEQIVWGGNYFADQLPVSRCWLSWYKQNPLDNFSDIELAWTSFDKVASQVRLPSYGAWHFDAKQGMKVIHPTQKPVALYKWLLTKYAKPTDRILDTHLGSGSIAIACHDMGFDLVGCELDTDYYNAACKRLSNHQTQLSLL